MLAHRAQHPDRVADLGIRHWPQPLLLEPAPAQAERRGRNLAVLARGREAPHQILAPAVQQIAVAHQHGLIRLARFRAERRGQSQMHRHAPRQRRIIHRHPRHRHDAAAHAVLDDAGRPHAQDRRRTIPRQPAQALQPGRPVVAQPGQLPQAPLRPLLELPPEPLPQPLAQHRIAQRAHRVADWNGQMREPAHRVRMVLEDVEGVPDEQRVLVRCALLREAQVLQRDVIHPLRVQFQILRLVRHLRPQGRIAARDERLIALEDHGRLVCLRAELVHPVQQAAHDVAFLLRGPGLELLKRQIHFLRRADHAAARLTALAHQQEPVLDQLRAAVQIPQRPQQHQPFRLRHFVGTPAKILRHPLRLRLDDARLVPAHRLERIIEARADAPAQPQSRLLAMSQVLVEHAEPDRSAPAERRQRTDQR